MGNTLTGRLNMQAGENKHAVEHTNGLVINKHSMTRAGILDALRLLLYDNGLDFSAYDKEVDTLADLILDFGIYNELPYGGEMTIWLDELN
jgi:hypothetical protein